MTLGGDPEFEVLSNGVPIRVRSLSTMGVHGDVGCDEAGDQLELRPYPSDDPVAVVNATEALLRGFAAKHPTFRVSSLGDTFPCGGHIHFGDLESFGGEDDAPDCDDCDTNPNPCDNCGDALYNDICEPDCSSRVDDEEGDCTLDPQRCPPRRNYNPCPECERDTDPCSDCRGTPRSSGVPLDLDPIVGSLDRVIGWTREYSGEARGGYGKPRDIETKEYGFEYRTPPASVWGTKAVALATLLAAEAVVGKADRSGRRAFDLPDRTFRSFLEAGVPVSASRVLTDFERYAGPPTPNVLRGWGVRAGVVHLTDAWDWYVAGGVQSVLERSHKPLLVYGLARDRGDVTDGWTYSEYDKIATPKSPRDCAARLNRIPIGVPRRHRVHSGGWWSRYRWGQEIGRLILKGVTR
jgi:hypothetical protein